MVMNEAPDRRDEMPEWQFPDLISHLLASQILATQLSIQLIAEGAENANVLQPIPLVSPTIPTLQPTFTPSDAQWTIIHRVDSDVEEINGLIHEIRTSPQHEQNAKLDRLRVLLEKPLHFDQ